MSKLKHFLLGLGSVLAPAVPVVVGSPAVQHFIETHPVYAAYFPVAAGVAVALYHHFYPPKGT